MKANGPSADSIRTAPVQIGSTLEHKPLIALGKGVFSKSLLFIGFMVLEQLLLSYILPRKRRKLYIYTTYVFMY